MSKSHKWTKNKNAGSFAQAMGTDTEPNFYNGENPKHADVLKGTKGSSINEPAYKKAGF